jgi:hypothetical protein
MELMTSRQQLQGKAQGLPRTTIPAMGPAQAAPGEGIKIKMEVMHEKKH